MARERTLAYPVSPERSSVSPCSDDDDAPEAVSMSTSKRAALEKIQSEHLSVVDANKKERQRRRDKDARLKEAASQRRAQAIQAALLECQSLEKPAKNAIAALPKPAAPTRQHLNHTDDSESAGLYDSESNTTIVLADQYVCATLAKQKLDQTLVSFKRQAIRNKPNIRRIDSILAKSRNIRRGAPSLLFKASCSNVDSPRIRKFSVKPRLLSDKSLFH